MESQNAQGRCWLEWTLNWRTSGNSADMDENPYHSPDSQSGAKPKTSAMSTVLTAVAVLGIVGVLIALMLPMVRSARPAAYRNACSNNLKQIAVALQNYSAMYDALPPAYTTDAEGKPLHSWRTLILPYLEE